MIDAVVVAVRESSDILRNNLIREYGGAPIYQITNEEGSGICEKYNLGIDKLLNQLDGQSSDHYTIFAHDDAVLRTINVHSTLIQMHNKKADIVGVAGNTKIPKLDPGYWWDGLVTGDFRGAGAVIHRTPGEDQVFHIESYGPYPQQAAALDGVWIAVRTECFKDSRLRFDAETLPGYHYYDVDFCATARSLGLSIWVGDILVLHDKWGRGVEDPAFEQHKQLFVKKWSKKKHLYYMGEPPKKTTAFVADTAAFGK